jgi:hypothetical protein
VATVLWGKRRGDVQYGSRDYWRRRIPIRPDVLRVAVNSTAYFDVGDPVVFTNSAGSGELVADVLGLEGAEVGVRYR